MGKVHKQQFLLIYDYFFPAFRAGGITQSTYNLYNVLKSKFEINVICSNKDLNGESLNEKNKLKNVKYVNKFYILSSLVRSNKKNLETVYLNGVFSPFFFLIPLIYFRFFFSNVRIVIAPRGMMQTGALEIRGFKKKFYINLINILGFFKNVVWHATDGQEKIDIEKLIGRKSIVYVASNIPKIPINSISLIEKESHKLKLIFLSLITEKKNLHLILLSLREVKKNVVLDIYGPIKDIVYWQKCLTLISKLPGNIQVNYCGVIEPINVQQTIQNYHGFILPSKGENFGHAIYESLSVGRPVIISEFTPWINLNEKRAGWNTKLTVGSISEAILELNSMDSDTYKQYCENAYKLASAYYQESTQMENYKKLFK